MSRYKYRWPSIREIRKLNKRLGSYSTLKLINELKKPLTSAYMRQKRASILEQLRYRKRYNLVEDEAKLVMSLMFDDG